MAITPFPDSPNLENMKRRAKALVKSARAGDSAALEQIGPYFGDPRAIGLQQAQLVLARDYGFSSWTKLKAHIERGAPEGETGERLATQFLDLVTVIYHTIPDLGPVRFGRAAALLEAHPEIRRENIYTAAAIGDVSALDRWLDRDPGLIERKGGPFQWVPLMYAAYARLPGASTLAAGMRLLERGADPNAHHMWGGQYKFTALTGVFGEGEGGPVKQPEHPDMIPFARALLEAGADPNDSQAAYNRCFTPDNTCLELLLEYGLTSEDRNNWSDEDGLPHPSQTMHFHLMQAIRRGFVDRARLLIDHGVDLERPDDSYDTRVQGHTPLAAARLMGQHDTAEALLAAGARERTLSPDHAFEAVCMSGDLDAARGMLAADPDLLARARQREMLCDAVQNGAHAALNVMIALGFDLNDATGGPSPLHEAALKGDMAILTKLLDAGADPQRRDPVHFSPPLVWAHHGANSEEVIALLDTVEMDIFTAAARGRIDQITARLAEDPSRLNIRFAEVKPLKEKPWETDWMTPLVYAVLNDRVESVRVLLDRGARVDVEDGREQSLHTIARERAIPEIVAMIEKAAS